MIHYTDRHIDVGLTGFAKALTNNEFIWPKLLPRYPVKKMGDKYWIYGEERFKIPFAKREDKSESGGVDWSMSSTTYDCEISALHTKISKRDRENADSPIRVEQDATAFVNEKVYIAIEYEVASMLTSTSNITTYTELDGNGSVDYDGKWDDPDNDYSHPRKAMDAGIKSIYDYTLKEANTIVIPFAVWLKLKEHPDMIEILKYTEGKQIIAGLEVPKTINNLNVLIAKAAYDSTELGQTRTSFTNFWGSSVLIAYINPRIGWGTDTLGVSFDCGGPVVRKWHDDDKNCDKIEYEEQGLDHVLIDAYCGYLLTEVIS